MLVTFLSVKKLATSLVGNSVKPQQGTPECCCAARRVYYWEIYVPQYYDHLHASIVVFILSKFDVSLRKSNSSGLTQMGTSKKCTRVFSFEVSSFMLVPYLVA